MMEEKFCYLAFCFVSVYICMIYLSHKTDIFDKDEKNMWLKIIIGLFVLIPTAIAVLLLFTGCAIKYNPALIFKYQHVLIPSSFIGGIIMLIPLLVGIVILVANLWKKTKK